ncbi:MAG: hypothetical protein GX318_00700 [Clostridia bacterium]|nr:hypothetical protein [Clostridia bacterium]
MKRKCMFYIILLIVFIAALQITAQGINQMIGYPIAKFLEVKLNENSIKMVFLNQAIVIGIPHHGRLEYFKEYFFQMCDNFSARFRILLLKIFHSISSAGS